MDITALSGSLATSSLAYEASTKVLAMSMEDNRVLADGMRKMLEMSVNPNIGGNSDISV